MNFDSLKKKRAPRYHVDEGLENVLTIPGASHTLWNISQAVLMHHWGDPKDSYDTRAWRSWGALGGKTDKPVSKKDFNSVMQIIFNVHSATLAFLLRYEVSLSHFRNIFRQTNLDDSLNNREIIASKPERQDFNQPGVAQEIVDVLQDVL